MPVMVSLMVSMSFSFCSVSNRFITSSWNSIFFDPVCVVSTLGGLLVITVFLSTCMSSWMLLIAILWSLPIQCWLGWWVLHLWRCLACLLGCSHRYIIWAFPRSSPSCSLLEHGSHDFVLSCCCPFYQRILLPFLNSSPNLLGRVWCFLYLCIEVSHHNRVVVWFP